MLVRHLDGAEVCLWDAQVIGLTAGLYVVVLMAVVNFAGVHRRLAGYLYGEFQIAGALGMEDLSPLAGPVVDALPEDGTVALIGDARAFVYPIPSDRLDYRTVFDVDAESTGGDVVRAWADGETAGKTLVIDPNELARFARTYWQIPPPPPDVAGRGETFVVPAAGTGR